MIVPGYSSSFSIFQGASSAGLAPDLYALQTQVSHHLPHSFRFASCSCRLTVTFVRHHLLAGFLDTCFCEDDDHGFVRFPMERLTMDP
jgi:hypothetical protein